MRGGSLRSCGMIRPVIVSILMMAWCIGRWAPEEVPDPDAPPDVMPASCVPATADPGGFDAVLYAGAGLASPTDTMRAGIAQDDLAALRYLIRAVRRPGVQPGLPLATRSRPLLHALNALTMQADRGQLPAAYLTALHTHYGTDAVLAVALARRETQPDPAFAALLERDGASFPALAHVQHCAALARAPTLKAQCGQPLVQRAVSMRGRTGQPLMWPASGPRLPGCESDVALAERLLERLPAWQASAEYADPDWRACYAGLVQHLAQRGDDRVDDTLLAAVHPGRRVRLVDVRWQAEWTWSQWTFEHALLALSPSRQLEPPRSGRVMSSCYCPGWAPLLVDAHPALVPRL